MPNTLRIALAQTTPLSADSGPPKLEKPHSTSPFPSIDQNVVDVSARVAQAAASGADVVVFPEYFLQGIANENRQYVTFASEHLTAFLQALASRHKIAIVGSIVHGSIPPPAVNAPFPTSSPFEHLLNAKPGGKITPSQLEWAKWLEHHPPAWEEGVSPVLRNTAFFIDDTGKLVAEYVKENLWHPERAYLTAGEDNTAVFETKWGRAAFQICWDVSHPGPALHLANLGADIIFHPTYWLANDSEPHLSRHEHVPNYESSVVQALCLARSFETETVWIMCNAGGDDKEGFMGGSGVWAPLRGRVGGCGVPAEIKVVELDLDVLKDARDCYKIREDWAAKQAT